MNRMARAALVAALLALGIVSACSVGCRGGGTLDGLDGSFDGQAVEVTATGDRCGHTIFSMDDDDDPDSGCPRHDE